MSERFAQLLLDELEKKQKRRIKVAVSWEAIEDLIKGALDPQPLPVGEDHIPASARPEIPPDFPKLKVRFNSGTGEPLEWIVVQNFNEEAPYHGGGWFTRRLGELEQLKTDGVKERPAEDWKRRKEFSTK